MNKKLLAAALGLAFAAPVFADSSNVVLYGRVHQAINHQGVTGTAPAGATGTAGQNMVITDVASRLGVKGEEDLGGGLKAVFAYEFTVDSDNGAGITGGRHAYLGLSSANYGTFVIGQQDGGNLSQAPLYNQASDVAYSVSNNGGVLQTVAGSYAGSTNSYGAVGTGVTSAGIQRDQRVGNSLGYELKVAGVQVNVRHALVGANDVGGVNGGTPATAYESGTRSSEVAATYKVGALKVGGGFEINEVNGTAVANSRKNLYQLVGEYDFGVAKLGLLYGHQKLANVAAGADDSRTDYRISGWMPITSNIGVVASYGKADQIANGNLNVKVMQVASYYDFSKRTRTYVGINQHKDEVAVGPTTKTTDLSIGLRHNF